MTRLRIIAISLLLIIGLLLNIERLDVGTQQNIVNLQTFVYILAGVAVLTTIALPIAGRISMLRWMGIWTGIYLVLKLLVFNNREILGGIFTYLTITELALLLLSLLIAHRFAREINDVEETIANIILPDDAGRAKRYEEAIEEVNRELLRSRRNNHLLSLLIVEPDPKSIQANLQRSAQEILESLKMRYVYKNLLRVITNEMRRTDLVLEESDRNRFILLLPDTDPEDADLLEKRISTLAEERLGITVSSGSASFPNQALTLDELVRQAEKQIESHSNGSRKNGRTLVVESVSQDERQS